jgi:hypothetical protein
MGVNNNPWVDPAGVTKVLVEEWGSGAGGYLGGFGGGGGAAYARTAGMPVTPGNTYNAATAIAGPANQPGDSSSFTADGGLVVTAVGGQASALGAGGLGGDAAACTGDVTRSGGNGEPSGGGKGGGGGGSAGDSSDGNQAIADAGGIPVNRGGGGGDGAPNNVADGNPGLPPGGGGGSSIGGAGKLGGEGATVIWDDTDGSGWPKYGTPLATFGSPPPNPVRPSNPKARKSVSIV